MARARNAGNAGEAVIGRSTRVRGRVTGDGDLRIEGAVEGDISLSGDLTISDGGTAASNVEANAVTVGGELSGDIRASGMVRLESGARVRGDITSGESVAMEEGAQFNGQLNAEFDLPAELGGTSARRR